MPPRNAPIDLEFLKYLSDDSLLSTKDIQAIFGFKNYFSVHILVLKNEFPPCDKQMRRIKTKNLLNYWKKSTVMEAIAKLNESIDK